jgi:XRE family aerobic/anaerobic benzoate catabolism transcriptional regulator
MDGSSEILARLGDRARRRRHRLGLTLRALADRSGLSPRFLRTVESGRGNISVRRLSALASALGTTPADLLATPASVGTGTLIALLGLRGSGKTTIGRRLAKRLRLRFVELDQQVEQLAGMALGEIFSLHGEDYYRRLERDALDALVSTGEPVVLAAGGGLVTAPETFATLRQGATSVWLRARPEDYWQRVIQQGDRRPMAQHPQAREALEQLVARRAPLYARADFTVDTAGLTVARVLRQVEQALGVT